jgi:hypothetical protein
MMPQVGIRQQYRTVCIRIARSGRRLASGYAEVEQKVGQRGAPQGFGCLERADTQVHCWVAAFKVSLGIVPQVDEVGVKALRQLEKLERERVAVEIDFHRSNSRSSGEMPPKIARPLGLSVLRVRLLKKLRK